MKTLKFYSIFLLLCISLLYITSNKQESCTDDGCLEFLEDEWTTTTEVDEIEQWIENPAATSLNFKKINLEYGVHTIVEKTYHLPNIDTSSKDVFVQSLNGCINYLYQNIEPEYQIPNELIIAQAVIETGWGKSRFANEGNNLFGIRTWNKDVPYLLPIPWTEWPGWGVKMYSSKCESVVDYLHILNNVHAFEELRTARANGVKDALELANYLDKYASKPTYVELVKEIIQYNLRGKYEL